MLARVLFLCLLIAAATETGSANNCCLPKVPGLCRGLFRRFYYNSLTGKCERFDYGGCGGNRNNFKSQNLCRQECDGTECGNCCLPKEPGFCRGYFPRFYYNGLTGKCERFIYGGCEGNRNNFKSQNLCRQECEGTECVNRCCLPEDPGPCFASLPRYSYDKVTSQCKPFIYGGCHGNRNNFISPQECIEACQDVRC